MRYGDLTYIYAIRHNKTKRVYIGCSSNPERIQQHLGRLKSGKHINEAMQRDCDKYGYDFTAYLLEIISKSCPSHLPVDPHSREGYWIHYYCTDDPRKGYNSPRIYRRVRITNFPVVSNNPNEFWGVLCKKAEKQK